jgi:restriction system protein
MSKIRYRSRHIEQLDARQLQEVWDVRGTRVLRYTFDIAHKGLHLHKTLSAPDLQALELKTQALISTWDDRFDGLLGRASAEQTVQDAETKRRDFLQILADTLSVDDCVLWESVKDKTEYKGEPPYKRQRFVVQCPSAPLDWRPPSEPVLRRISFIPALFGAKGRARHAYELAMDAHKKHVLAMREREAALKLTYDSAYSEWDAKQKEWFAHEDAKEAIWSAQEEARKQAHNAVIAAKIDRLEIAWRAGDPAAIVEHATMVLDASDYGDLFSPDFELDWKEDARILLVTYRLPLPDDIPDTKTAKLNNSTGEVKTTRITEKEHAAIFDEVCYQICLRTIHELYEADTCGHIQGIVFNGLADHINRATGNQVQAIIMSLHAQREPFLALNLRGIDPKACFKALKGVAASSLAGLAAVAPIMRLDKTDRRFVEARDVDLGDDGGTNLAAMPWEDFEHLIRSVFEKEYGRRGGEVKVTQASRDGGVDAIAFDPDPISGGKTVIQAKRYTRTVGVSAVRDLYGTVMAEGANKGILVTTADYGPDAYAFVAGKPLTLLNGANLLYLLETHGTRARIDIAEARSTEGLNT